MSRNPNKLQKLSSGIGILSFISAAVCAIFLYLKIAESGANNPVSASLLASIFFFIFVGLVLMVIGKTNLPSFKPNNVSNENSD